MLRVLATRFAKFGLTLHPEKTRLVEFGRHALAKAERTGGKCVFAHWRLAPDICLA